ncbi:MAG: methylmalonyl Co-A mutase-associated GTPase MeaB [Bacteroidota bacterium]|nr:methylmalonyl Co-A mutase-associated GTPase MeaB [Bacteroidota bacterium]
MNWQDILAGLAPNNTRAIARGISLIENEQEGYALLLEALPSNDKTLVLGITGPPGAGKSSLTDALIAELVKQQQSVAVLCVDPSSPFHRGALLGDRIRMSQWYNHPNVYIRSLATRGALGGLHPKTIEIADFVKAAGFDCVIIETVGVGQTELEIAGLADVTTVVLVPEAGDDVQAMKSGLMEIAQVFAVNKSDRPGADLFANHLRASVNELAAGKDIAIVKTSAINREGIAALWTAIRERQQNHTAQQHKSALLAEKAWQIIGQRRMKNLDIDRLRKEIEVAMQDPGFNFYKLVASLQ